MYGLSKSYLLKFVLYLYRYNLRCSCTVWFNHTFLDIFLVDEYEKSQKTLENGKFKPNFHCQTFCIALMKEFFISENTEGQFAGTPDMIVSSGYGKPGKIVLREIRSPMMARSTTLWTLRFWS